MNESSSQCTKNSSLVSLINLFGFDHVKLKAFGNLLMSCITRLINAISDHFARPGIPAGYMTNCFTSRSSLFGVYEKPHNDSVRASYIDTLIRITGTG